MKSKNFSIEAITSLANLDFYNPTTEKEVSALAEHLGQMKLSKHITVSERQLITIGLMLRDAVLNGHLLGTVKDRLLCKALCPTFTTALVPSFNEQKLKYLNICFQHKPKSIVILKPITRIDDPLNRILEKCVKWHKTSKELLKSSRTKYHHHIDSMLIFGSTGEFIFNKC